LNRLHGILTRRTPIDRFYSTLLSINTQLKFKTVPTDTLSVMNEAVTRTTQIAIGSASSESEILTVMEVAQFLRVPKSTVYKLARLGQLPASKIGKHWRFLRRDIHEWMHNRTQQT
jgi:excisionase family DNA binding protein